MCLDRLQIVVDKCAPSDQACLCKEKYSTLVCYNNCLEDKEYQGKRANRESEVLAHCRAANINTKELLPTSTATSSEATDKPKETGNGNKDTSKSEADKSKGSSSSRSSVYHYSSVAALSALTYSVLYL
ncbi:hypothetical protein K502DRAFT_325319 [Neoconidiobolus thromboides FSU 785]|nr:hypothetical protein K502DRAFT_325319 [Neoconidiobolus thromboides FSU 785]